MNIVPAMGRAPGQTIPFDAYAPPQLWGPWVNLIGLLGGPFQITIDAYSISDAPSSFSVEVEYFAAGGVRQIDSWTGPGSYTIETEADAAQQPRIRFKSHSVNGLAIQGTYYVVAPRREG